MPFVSKLSKERFIHLYEEECLAVLEYEDITIKLTPYFNFKPDGSSHPFRFTTARYECFFLFYWRVGQAGIMQGRCNFLVLWESCPGNLRAYYYLVRDHLP